MKMKQLAVYTILLLSACACKESPTSSHQETTHSITEIMKNQDQQQIEALLSTYQQALNTSDAKLAQSLYTEDGIFMPTEGPSGIGAEAILKSYEFVFSAIQLNIQFHIDEIKVEGSMAFAVTSSQGTTLIHATGDTVPEANRELFVFEKVNNSWKIARYMFNKTAPKQ